MGLNQNPLAQFANIRQPNNNPAMNMLLGNMGGNSGANMFSNGLASSLTQVWTARQLIILQLKFTMIVCYLSTHINVVILTASIFACNAFVFVIWSRLMSTSRKAKQKYSNPNYEENENES